MGNHKGFRGWYYLRVGWTTYFAFLFAVVNTSVVTYYLAIEEAPFLQAIFPSFLAYIGILTAIGLPILIIAGYLHFQRSRAYGSEAEIATETNPYFYKIIEEFEKISGFPILLNTSFNINGEPIVCSPDDAINTFFNSYRVIFEI